MSRYSLVVLMIMIWVCRGPVTTIWCCIITESIRGFVDNVKLSYGIIVSSVVNCISVDKWPVLLMGSSLLLSYERWLILLPQVNYIVCVHTVLVRPSYLWAWHSPSIVFLILYRNTFGYCYTYIPSTKKKLRNHLIFQENIFYRKHFPSYQTHPWCSNGWNQANSYLTKIVL